jgi:hypothetical protein
MLIRSVTTAGFLLLVSLVTATSTQAGDPIQCSCNFDSGSGYSAVGTRAACSSFTKEKACTIAFGGVGSQPLLASKIGIDPKQLMDEAFKLTIDNLTAIRNNNPGQIANSAFVQQAIVVYMRAAYLREGLEIDPATLRDLDNQVQGFSREFGASIADVFSSRRGPFNASWQDRHVIEVDRGAVRFIYDKRIVIVAAFF